MYKASLHHAKRYWLVLLLAASGIMPATAAPVAAQLEVAQVQLAIKKTQGQAQWTAGHTSMTAMTLAERRQRLGITMPRATAMAAAAATAATAASYPAALTAAATLPASFDWRNVNGHSFVTPIKNQGGCGSCWAFASTAALESKALIAMNTPDVNLNLSEQVLLSCSGAGSCGGGYVNKVANFLVGTGDSGESTFAYTGADTACAKAAAGWKDSAYKITSWQFVANWNNKVTPDMIKNALINSGPLPVTFNVNNDFYSYKSGVYSSVGSSYVGRHAVTIVGYDDAAQAFIVKNSWGTGWGENGYFRVAYNQLYGAGSTVEFGQEVLAYGPAIKPGTVCLYSLSQTSQTTSAAAYTGSVDVTVSAGATCAWTAVSNASWITVTSGNSGSANGKVSYSVTANSGAAARTGTITIGDQTFTVTQAAANNPVPACTLNSSATSIVAGASATLTASCSPAATSYTWTNSGFSSSVSSGKVTPASTTTYSVKGSNASGSGNTASVTVAVSAPTPPPTCTLSASATSVMAGDAVTLKASCSPDATSYAWTNTGFAANVASGSVAPTTTTTYSVSGANSTGKGNVASVQVTVNSVARPVCSLSASPTSIKAGATSALTATCIPAATSYKWGNTNFAASAAGGNVAPTTTTTYSVSGINAGGTGDAVNATVTVTNSKPLTPSQLITPSGTIVTTTPAYSWSASAGATNYYLHIVNRTTGKVVLSWHFTPVSLGCGAGTGTCTIKPGATLVNGSTYGWMVLAANSAGYSPWSREVAFQVANNGGPNPEGPYDAGPIWNNAGAQAVCPGVCVAKGLKWSGAWWTTVQGKTSVCGCVK
jgi:C1A family cysteine protease